VREHYILCIHVKFHALCLQHSFAFINKTYVGAASAMTPLREGASNGTSRQLFSTSTGQHVNMFSGTNRYSAEEVEQGINEEHSTDLSGPQRDNEEDEGEEFYTFHEQESEAAISVDPYHDEEEPDVDMSGIDPPIRHHFDIMAENSLYRKVDK
jgi:hypothetical protein